VSWSDNQERKRKETGLGENDVRTSVHPNIIILVPGRKEMRRPISNDDKSMKMEVSKGKCRGLSVSDVHLIILYSQAVCWREQDGGHRGKFLLACDNEFILGSSLRSGIHSQ